MKKAVSAVIDGTLSSYSAADQYDVPRGTVARHVAYYKRTGQRLNIGEGLYPPHHCKALNSLICADVPLRNYSLTH